MARILSFFTVNLVSDSPGAAQFYNKVSQAGKVLVLDLGFLGDTVQLIPACHRIRQALPEAELHVMVADHIKDILRVTPWIDKVLGYPRHPRSEPLPRDFPRVRQLRRERYDAVINLNGSDRSSILTGLSGAPLRLGRVPPKVAAFWKWCYTDWVNVPHGRMPVYRARLQCLDRAGFPSIEPDFGVEIPADVAATVADKLDPATGYLHVSPFTTLDYKELPEAVLAEFIDRFQAAHPETRLAISCAPNQRERSKLDALLARLQVQPWRVFPGDLSLVELAALIAGARMHIGGDSGAMHVAFMAGAPTLIWFRNYDNLVEWMPDGGRHRHVIGEESERGLQGITAQDLLNAANAMLAAR